ncbi:inactive peptidyl-prolyl cis-trans isomerase FKBP6 [Rhipicephalus sanguineus]|uniref:inactive peptidyl-prolyl cis-trans isomerase FKBP6 n=1 Tax=Rhipicephalus sanguineus TaxID=34632 RepID=UPI0018930156|nr:inactive peptidyl-prolyl cis-trans isomerase FKBP6 [Rhipicephalus sanguineus]XP_049275199.1 inactive peptidyl-prolyl cis-trans isomerase FKBP6 [Rhipicephalus sanguineus]
MEKEITEEVELEYVRSVLKEPLTYEKVQHGTVFEIQPESTDEDKEEEQKSAFEPAKLMENLRLDLLGGGEDEVDPNSEITLPFERMASSMQPLTKDGGVLKKVMKPGTGPMVPPGSGVCFHYNAYLEMADEPFDSTRLRGHPFRCLLDDMIIPGLSLAVATMRKGEIARFLVAPQYAFGRMGCPPRIPANATILYEVELQFIVSAKDELELKSFMQEGDERRMPFTELVERCVAKRRIGNTFFEQGEYQYAIRSYMSAIRALEDARTSNEEEDNQRSEVLLMLYNNVSLCFIKTGKAEAAITYGKRALLSHPDDARALYRVGVGLKMTGEFDSAAKYLRKALQKQPNSTHAAEQLKNIDCLKRQLFAKESDMCRRMFNTGKSSTAEDEAKRIVAMEKSGVTPKMKNSIRERLEKFKQLPSSTPITFTAGFSEAHFDYIRAVSRSLGLKCEDLPEEGVKVSIE